MSGPGALCGGPLCRAYLDPRVHPHRMSPIRSAGPQLRSACHPSHSTYMNGQRARGPARISSDGTHPVSAFSSDPRDARPVRGLPAATADPFGPRAPAQIRVPPIQPGAFLFSRREPQTLLFGGNSLHVQLSSSKVLAYFDPGVSIAILRYILAAGTSCT